MVIHLTINGQPKDFVVNANESLMSALRREGYYSVKHGCETGDCGACGVLLRRASETPAAEQPFALMNTCVMLAAQADGTDVVTVESLGDRKGLSVIQQCFIDNGAIQCGFCTPAQMLAAKALLDKNPNPTEDEVREAISGVLCRCTGYLKPVQAVMNAAARISGGGGDPQPPRIVRTVDRGPGRREESLHAHGDDVLGARRGRYHAARGDAPL